MVAKRGHGGLNGVPDGGPTPPFVTPDRGPKLRRGRALMAPQTAVQTAVQTAPQTAPQTTPQRALLTAPVCPPEGTLRPSEKKSVRSQDAVKTQSSLIRWA